MLNETDVNVFSAINQKFLLLDYCDFKDALDKFNCVKKMKLSYNVIILVE